jgi:hypothetical protein
MENLNLINLMMSILALLVFGFVLTGAWLLVDDSSKMFNLRKDLKRKHPDLTKGQLQALARHQYAQSIKDEK